MAQLLGPDGNPIQKDVLTREIAAPSIASVRQVIAPDPSIGLTPQRLARLLRASEEGDAEEYLALAERMEEKDLHYLSVLGTRKRAVAQLEIHVEPGGETPDDEANAELVRAWLKRDTLDEELEDILDAVGKGFSVTEIVWETSERDWTPKRLCWVDPRWMEIDRIDGRTLRLRGTEGPRDLEPLKFIVHNHPAKSGLPIRGGLARVAGWAYLFKNYTVKDWVAFAEIYGQPMRVGKYPASATQDERRTLLRAVAQIGTDAAAIIPEGMLIEFVRAEGASANADIYAKLAEFMDKQISKGVLGQTLTTEVGSEGGSRAAGEVHDKVRGDIRRSDKKKLAATLTAQLVKPLVELNRGPQKAYPSIVLLEPESHDPSKVLDNAAKAAKLGIRVSKSDVLKKAGLKEADADDPDDVIEPPSTNAQGQVDRAPNEEFGEPPQGGASPKSSRGQPPKPTGKATAAAVAAAAAGGEHVHDHPRDDDHVRDRAHPRDAIDDLVDAMMEEWEPAMAPIIEPILKLAEEAATLEEFRRRLPELIGKMKTAALEDLLARGGFVARLAGDTGVKLFDAPRGQAAANAKRSHQP